MTATTTSAPPEQANQAIEPKAEGEERTVTIPDGMPFRPLSDPANRVEHESRKRKKLKGDTNATAKVDKATSSEPKLEPTLSPVKRKRRVTHNSQPPMGAETKPSKKSQQTVAEAPPSTDQPEQVCTSAHKELSELEQLAVDAKAQKPGAIKNLRAYLDGNPQVYREFGDLAKAARYGFAKLSCPDSPLQCESILARAEETLAKYLPEGADSPTEQILAEQIIVCSMRVNYYDFQTSNYATCDNPQFVTLLLRKHEVAQNQLFKAISKLQNYRRLKSL